MEGDKKRQPAVSPSTTPKKHKPLETHKIETKEEKMEKSMNTVASTDMCIYCFDSLMSHFFKHFEKSSPTFTNDCYPLFVTWDIGSAKRLRGCIGTFTSISLHKGIKEYALTSAMSDSRFSPVSKAEISQLSVSVSLLVDFEDASNYLDWTVGVHGIRIEVAYNHSKKSATYLPEVAEEQEWTKEETIEALLKKAGVKSRLSQSLKDSIRLTRYRSEKVEMSFEEYAKTKNNVLELLNGCMAPVSNGH